MDQKARRSSILKIRQPVDVLDETAAPSATTIPANRRVSFHNVKHVKQYDREHGKIIEESPLREKITDTLDSDGILTPRGRTDGPQYDHSFSVFGQGTSSNATMDMSVETVHAEDDTIRMFDGAKTFCAPSEKENVTIHEERDMSIDQSVVFAVPHPMNATINQSVLMELDESERTLRACDTMDLFAPLTSTNNDNSVAPNDTLTMFQSPARKNATKVFSDDDMELTHVENQEHVDMDISEAPNNKTDKNDTLQMFSEVKQEKVVAETKVFEDEMELTLVEKAGDDSMDISMTPCKKTILPGDDTIGMFKSPEQKNNLQHDDMDISQSAEIHQMCKSPETKGGDDMEITLQESPARAVKEVSMCSMQKVFDEEPKEKTLPEEIRDHSSTTIDGREKERSMLQTSLMEVVAAETTLNNSEKTEIHSVSPGITLGSPQKTMQIASNLTSTFNETSPLQEPIQEVVEHIVEHQSFHNESYDMSLDMEVTSRLSVSMNRSLTSRRRRSMLRESPRRVALENSMISFGAAEVTALEEYRRRKSLQKSQQNLLNSTNQADLSLGRNIFTMNTSIRSPKTIGKLTIPEEPAPVPFELPEFDAAVANIVWLTSEDGNPIPEAKQFTNVLNAEKEIVENEIQKALDLIDGAKFEAVRNGKLSQLSSDEKEVVVFARGHAESKFLHLRHAFAEEHLQKYGEKIHELQMENAQLAGQLLDLEDEELLRREVEVKRKLVVLADADKIRAEWRENQRLETERRIEQLTTSAALMLELHQERLAMLKEKEQLEEQIARLNIEQQAFDDQLLENLEMINAKALE